MEIKDTNYKRYFPSEGKAIKWSEKIYGYSSKKEIEVEKCSNAPELIDQNQLTSEVVEIEMSEYEEWTKDKYLGLACNL